MSTKKKVGILLLNFPTLYLPYLLDFLIGGYGHTLTIYKGWLFIEMNLLDLLTFLMIAPSLIIWTSIFILGVYTFFRRDIYRDRGLLVISFTLVAATFLTIAISTLLIL